MKKSIAIICALMTPSVAVLDSLALAHMRMGKDKDNTTWTEMTKTPENRIKIASTLWGEKFKPILSSVKDQKEILAAMHGTNGQNCVNSVLALDEPGSLRMALYLIGKDTCNTQTYLPWLKTSHEEVCLQERFMGMVKHDPSGLIGFHLESVYKNIADPEWGIEDPKWDMIGELSDIWTERRFEEFVQRQAEQVPEQCSAFVLLFDPEMTGQELRLGRIIGPQKKTLLLPEQKKKRKAKQQPEPKPQPEITIHPCAMNAKEINVTLDGMRLEGNQRDEIKNWIETHLLFWQNPDKRSEIMEEMGINAKLNTMQLPKLEKRPDNGVFQIEDYENKLRNLLQDEKGEINLYDDEAIETEKQKLYPGPDNKHKRNEVNRAQKGLQYLKNKNKFFKEYSTFFRNY